MTPLYKHQEKDIAFILDKHSVLNFSDPGTGKTRTMIEVIRARKKEGRTLVLCPKSIMQPAWGEDLNRFAPELTYTLAYSGGKRAEAFHAKSDIVIMNHDGVSWLREMTEKRNTPLLKEFVQLIVDESTAFKNDSDRTKHLFKLIPSFKYKIILTGTPYTNTILDVWRQVFIADQGAHLGTSFYKFRAECCQSKQLGNGITIWEDKPGIEPLITSIIQDITIRHKMEDCIDIPENNTHTIDFTPNKEHLDLYRELETHALLELKNKQITAVNAAVLAGKLLQIASGAVYSDDGNYEIIDNDRYELIKEIAEQRDQVVIAFRWQHQKEQLLKILKNVAVIDGSITAEKRTQNINAFQNGNIKHLLIHPRAGAHGITLTKGTTTIWASPTYSSEEFIQLNRRIYRAGQTKKTETILTCANHTLEGAVYEKLQGKINTLNLILELFK